MRQAVSSPRRNRASFWRARMAAESGSNSGARRRAPSASVPRRDRQPLAGQPVGDPVEGPKTRIALVQKPRPHAGPVGRVREQARHRRRRDFRRRGGAVAASAPARARDHARVRLDGHLDQFRRVGAVRHIQFPAIGADALVRRGVVNFRALFETRPGRATMAGGAGLLAARTVRPRPFPALALAPEPRLGMHRLRRAILRQLRLELPDTGSLGRDLQAQRGDSCSACAQSMPASASSRFSRPTSARSDSAFRAARRTSPASARAPASLSRPISNCRRQDRALARQPISPRRSSSARRRSRSNSDRQSGSPPPEDGAAGPPPSEKGGPDPSSRTGAGIVRKTCAGNDMRTKITHVEERYQHFAIETAEQNRANLFDKIVTGRPNAYRTTIAKGLNAESS